MSRAPTSLRAKVARWGAVIGVVLGGAAGGLTAALSVFDADVVTTTLVTIFCGMVAAFIGLAITEEPEARVRLLSCALVSSLAVPITLGAGYWRAEEEPIVELVVDDGDSDVIYAVGEPGGDAIVSVHNSGPTVLVECSTSFRGETWYRLATFPTAWLPGSAVRPGADEEMPDVRSATADSKQMRR